MCHIMASEVTIDVGLFCFNFVYFNFVYFNFIFVFLNFLLVVENRFLNLTKSYFLLDKLL